MPLTKEQYQAAAEETLQQTLAEKTNFANTVCAQDITKMLSAKFGAHADAINVQAGIKHLRSALLELADGPVVQRLFNRAHSQLIVVQGGKPIEHDVNMAVTMVAGQEVELCVLNVLDDIRAIAADIAPALERNVAAKHAVHEERYAIEKLGNQ